ncbi:MAG: RHS repeat-associated core domain-containing protein [Terriglobales bacterium]
MTSVAARPIFFRTLGTLGISDPFSNTSDTQNCSYVYDDLARINSVNCMNGSTNVWNQSFTLDPFGNLSKSGSITFAANYVLSNGTTNNQEQSVGTTCVPTYDANGNMTKDCSFSSPPKYTWDSDGNAIQVRSSSLTFDAFDREVEFANGSAITQVLYGPIGKMGLMNGQTPSITRIPLPGGSTAKMVGTSGVTYIMHTDWLGSARLTTAYNTRSMYYDTAYAPYGESYSSTSTSTSNLDFTGQFEDTMNGLYDFLYREYDPVQGRWIRPDPAGAKAVVPRNPQTWNRYAYVLNNPLRYVDPQGWWCVWDDGTGHDDDPGNGGDSEDKCTEDGGHWDPYDTYTNLVQIDGVVTQLDYVGEKQTCTTSDCGAGMTLEGFDQTLKDYSIQGANPINISMGDWDHYMKDTINSITGVTFPGNEGPVHYSWRNWATYLGCAAGMDPDYATPMGSPSGPPTDSTDSTPETEGQSKIGPSNGPGGQYNPQGSVSATRVTNGPSAAALTAQEGQCINNGSK